MAERFTDVQSILDTVGDFSRRIYDDFLDPLSERFAFVRAPTTGEHTGDPMVLILGNHSSGKSTFINHMLQEEIQRTGLAPIDDGFTILGFGEPDEKDGHATVTNPDLPFADLERFGPKLISHLRMKRTTASFLKGISLVDTPGMIDAADAQLGRGYDFISAVRWFVERSDVVLVFFDPDKPGTTGETLKVFTSALLDIDHKLLIVLNKMDQFRTLRDFARAYGALCWNLSKVIPRKDLPMIYNTYVPVEGAPTPALPLKDFADAREEVITEIRRAPARRIDNILTRLHDHARKLRVHSRVCSAATRTVRAIRLQFLLMGIAAVVIGVAVAYLTRTLGAGWAVPLCVAGGGLLVGAGLYYFGKWQAKTRSKELISGLSGVFESVYHNELVLSGAADDLKALWQAVQERAVQALGTLGIDAIKPLNRPEERRLGEIIDREIPALRSKVHESIRELAASGKFSGPLPPLPEGNERAGGENPEPPSPAAPEGEPSGESQGSGEGENA
ncbi:MAG: dynamin family protein [Planctomycetota bacterium]|jgi:GTPase SAR1 family protein